MVQQNYDFIQHYGVKGQRWGVRRYQNADGTLTAAGKKRAAQEQRRQQKEADKKRINERKQAYKNRRSLSDEELSSRIKRLEQEKRLKALTEEDIAPGRSAAKQILSSTGKKVLYTAAVGAAVYAGHYAVTGKFDPNVAANYIFPNPNRKK